MIKSFGFYNSFRETKESLKILKITKIHEVARLPAKENKFSKTRNSTHIGLSKLSIPTQGETRGGLVKKNQKFTVKS